MEIFIFSLVLGVIPAMIASSKGRSFAGWYIYGVLLFVIAIVHSLLIKEDKNIVEEKEIEQGNMRVSIRST